MGFFSKVWKGVKKHVKRIARGVKKVAKKVAHALPGGKALWKAGTKLGQGLMKGLGKITNALGPVGMFALSFVTGGLAGIAGTLFSAIPGYTAISTFAGEVVKNLGAQALKVFGGDGFINKTIGKLGEAITQGVGKMVPESVKGITKDLVTQFKTSFPDVHGKLVKAGDKIFGTGQSFTDRRLATATDAAENLIAQNAPGLPQSAFGGAVEDLVQRDLANPGIVDQIKLLGDKTGISKAVKVGKNIQGLAQQAGGTGVGAADTSAPVQQVRAPTVTPAPTTQLAPAGRISDPLRAVGGGQNDFFAQLVAQAQQNRGGFA